MSDYGKISVIMACYNCEKTVEKAIRSILDQTYTDWVLICCDDGSTDGTLQVLEKYRKLCPEKIIVIRNEKNSKLPYSLNHCLQYVQTELVARMDADDWSDPRRFEVQAAFLRQHPEYDLVGTGINVSDGSEVFAVMRAFPEPTKETMLRQNAFLHATIMTYKRVYDALGGYSLDPTVIRVEDVDLWCRFLAHGFRGYNLPEPLYTILEDKNAAKRRGFSARYHSALTRYRGYGLMGFRGWVRVKPFLLILRAFVPQGIYRIVHEKKLRSHGK